MPEEEGPGGKRCCPNTGLLSQEAGISEDGDATLNSDASQLGRFPAVQTGGTLRAPWRPPLTTRHFAGGGTGNS